MRWCDETLEHWRRYSCSCCRRCSHFINTRCAPPDGPTMASSDSSASRASDHCRPFTASAWVSCTCKYENTRRARRLLAGMCAPRCAMSALAAPAFSWKKHTSLGEMRANQCSLSQSSTECQTWRQSATHRCLKRIVDAICKRCALIVCIIQMAQRTEPAGTRKALLTVGGVQQRGGDKGIVGEIPIARAQGRPCRLSYAAGDAAGCKRVCGGLRKGVVRRTLILMAGVRQVGKSKQRRKAVVAHHCVCLAHLSGTSPSKNCCIANCACAMQSNGGSSCCMEGGASWVHCIGRGK